MSVTMPISDCQVRDPRIRRTRKLLQGALGTLMRSKRFDEISVQDITEAATVNRATFYDHYTDKYALLEAMVAGGFHELLHARQLRYHAGCPEALEAIVLATCDFLSQAHADGECERQTSFEPLMGAAITKAIQRLLLEGMQRDEHSAMERPELIAAAASAAIGGAVKQWYSLPDRPPAQVIAPQIAELILPMLAAESPARVAAGHPESSPGQLR
jgi:AcrR family transcriptional regulator